MKEYRFSEQRIIRGLMTEKTKIRDREAPAVKCIHER